MTPEAAPAPGSLAQVVGDWLAAGDTDPRGTGRVLEGRGLPLARSEDDPGEALLRVARRSPSGLARLAERVAGFLGYAAGHPVSDAALHAGLQLAAELAPTTELAEALDRLHDAAAGWQHPRRWYGIPARRMLYAAMAHQQTDARWEHLWDRLAAGADGPDYVPLALDGRRVMFDALGRVLPQEYRRALAGRIRAIARGLTAAQVEEITRAIAPFVESRRRVLAPVLFRRADAAQQEIILREAFSTAADDLQDGKAREVALRGLRDMNPLGAARP